MSYSDLLSGTDIRATAVGSGCRLDDGTVRAIAAGFLEYLTTKTGLPADRMRLAVGRDCRVSGQRIMDALTDVFTSAGVTVLDCGLASTPAMFMTTVELGVTASVQITASHHPWDRNGIKFFTSAGGFEAGEVSRILSLAQTAVCPVAAKRGELLPTDFMKSYAASLRQKIIDGVGAGDRPLEGFRICEDAGNGVGGFYAKDVLEPLGADISGSRYLEPDGMFPNHIPNPEDPRAMDSIRDAVVSSGADLGVIFDTDVDRAACVSSDGEEINRNRLVALASYIALRDCPGGTIVTDSVTSDGLKEFIEQKLGGHHYRYRRGYKNVIDKGIELNRAGIPCPLAIETSGHAAMKENYFLDDGAYLITKIIILAAALRREGRDIKSVIKDLREPVEAVELRFGIKAEDFRAAGADIVDRLRTWASTKPYMRPADDDREGCRISFDAGHGSGWLLLRVSVHDPVMPLNIESDVRGGAAGIARAFREFISTGVCLDTQTLDAYLKGAE